MVYPLWYKLLFHCILYSSPSISLFFPHTRHSNRIHDNLLINKFVNFIKSVEVCDNSKFLINDLN